MITEKINQLKQQFSALPSWEERYRLMIQIGRKLEPMPEQYQIEKYRVRGCQSQVWLRPWLENGKMMLMADSDAVLVKGIIGILVEVYSGHTPAEVMSTSPDFLKELGITEQLSMNRTNGLASMIRQIQMYATAFNSLVEKGVNDANP